MHQERAACIVNWLHNVNKRTYAEYDEADSKHGADSSSNRMPTPDSALPSQDRRRDASPTKKRKVLQNSPDGDDDNSPSNNASGTPQSQGVPLRIGRPGLPPSSASSSKPSKRSSRRSSPVKKKQVLMGLEKPVRFTDLEVPSQQLPDDVRSLYTRINNIAFYHSNYLPTKDREKISQDTGRDIPEFSFKKPDAESHFDQLREIMLVSQECQELGRSELAVNMLVHAPLLKLALKNHHYVDEELIQTARICPSFIPPLADVGGNEGKVTEGKMVDLALVLTPAADGSRAPRRPPKANKHDTPADKRLLQAIQTYVLHREPPESQSVNQSTYTPVMFRPIAISIETKADGGTEEGKLQLAIWTSAWHRRMLSIMSKLEQGEDDSSQRLWAFTPRKVEAKMITLPLILVLGKDWKLLFACDRGDSLEILGYDSIGETSTLLGLYTIVAVLQELADWVEVTFRKWIMDIFKIDPDEGEDNEHDDEDEEDDASD